MELISLREGILAFLLFTVSGFSGAVVAEPSRHQFGQFYYQIDRDLPDWVSPVRPPRSKGTSAGQGTEYLLVDTQVKATHQEYVKYYATSSVLHTSQAVADGSELHMYFNPLYQELIIHDVSVFRKRKKIGSVDPKNIRLLQREEDLKNGIYDGVVTAIAIIPNTRVGDQINYKYTVVGRNPVYGEKVFGAYTMGWSVDVRLTNLRLLVPENLDVRTREHKLDLTPKIKKKDGYKEFVWREKNSKAIFDEKDYPSWFIRYPWVEFSEYQSWFDVKEWAQKIYKSVDHGSDELDQLVADLKSKSKNTSEFISNALSFSQESIRYLGLEFGQNTHLPHSSRDVILNRFGDCKDKSNLLVQILRSEGIEAYPALVSHKFREGFADFLPSPSAFDHVVVNIKVNKKDIWVDPTKTYQATSVENTGFTYFGKALVISDLKDQAVVDVSPLDTQNESTFTYEKYSYRGDKKPAKFEVETTYRGAAAEYQRYRFSINSLSEIQKTYLSFYSKTYPKISAVGAIEIKDDRYDNVFTIYEKYRIEGFSSVSDGLHKTSYYASSIDYSIKSPEQRIRDTPVAIGYPKRVRHKIVVDFKDDVDVSIDSTPIVRKVGGVEYRSRSDYRNKRYEFDADFRVKGSAIEKVVLDDYLALVGEIGNDVNFSLSFYYPYKKKMSNQRKSLLRSLKEVGFD